MDWRWILPTCINIVNERCAQNITRQCRCLSEKHVCHLLTTHLHATQRTREGTFDEQTNFATL